MGIMSMLNWIIISAIAMAAAVITIIFSLFVQPKVKSAFSTILIALIYSICLTITMVKVISHLPIY